MLNELPMNKGGHEEKKKERGKREA